MEEDYLFLALIASMAVTLERALEMAGISQPKDGSIARMVAMHAAIEAYYTAVGINSFQDFLSKIEQLAIGIESRERPSNVLQFLSQRNAD